MTNSAFESFRGRPAPHQGMKVRVYKNLNRASRYSLVALEGPYKSKVLGYAPAVSLRSVTLKISEPGRQRVIREQCRNVHGWAEGLIDCIADAPPAKVLTKPLRRITYQPFLKGFFWDREAPETPIWSLPQAWACGPDLICTE